MSEQKSGRVRARGPRWKAVSIVTRAAVALVIIGVGAGVSGWLASAKPDAARKERPDGPIVVRAVALAPVPVARVWTGYGTARAMRAAVVSAEVAGRVVERPGPVEPGAAVRAGQVLVRIDATDYERRVAAAEHAVAAARAQLASLDAEALRVKEQAALAESERELAQRDLDRSRRALEAGAANPGEVEQREAAVQRADRAVSTLRQAVELVPTRREALQAQLDAERANLALAAKALERTTVRSPIDGVLQSVSPRLGDYLPAGAAVARVVDGTLVEVPLALPASSAGRLGKGDDATLRSDGPAGNEWAGSVARFSPEADPDARTLTAFVEVRQAESGPGLLLPGMLVTGRVSEAKPQPRLLVPRRAIDGDRVLVAVPTDPPPGGDAPQAVWRVDSVAVRTLFTVLEAHPELDAAEREWAVLADGGPLRPGDRVITSNLDQLRPGMLVRLSDAAVGPAASPIAPPDPAASGVAP